MNGFRLTLQYVFVDLFGGLIRWPVWWYTKGLVLTLKWAQVSITRYAGSIGLMVWIKNIFVPMYGLRDWQGRLISFFVRLVQIFFRGLFLCVYTFFLLFAVAVYVTVPILAVIQLFYHAVGPLL